MKRLTTILLSAFLSLTMWAQGADSLHIAASASSDSLPADTFHIRNIADSVDFGHGWGRYIDIIVIHSNYYVGADPYDVEGCISQFRRYDVAPHYLITRTGEVLQMVDEKAVAWHAGTSRLPGTDRTSLNSSSIGIEIINTKKQGPTPEQYSSLVSLVRDICSRHPIRHIVRHSDIAPGRKTDPWCFDWDGFMKKVKSSDPPQIVNKL